MADIIVNVSGETSKLFCSRAAHISSCLRNQCKRIQKWTSFLTFIQKHFQRNYFSQTLWLWPEDFVCKVSMQAWVEREPRCFCEDLYWSLPKIGLFAHCQAHFHKALTFKCTNRFKLLNIITENLLYQTNNLLAANKLGYVQGGS